MSIEIVEKYFILNFYTLKIRYSYDSFQKNGEINAKTVKTSRRPNIIKKLKNNFAVAGKWAKLSTGPTLPMAGPTFPRQAMTAPTDVSKITSVSY